MIKFALRVEDGWPPVALEEIACIVRDDGIELADAPLYVKDISCGDVIRIDEGSLECVQTWHHVVRSRHTTVWLLRTKTPNNIDSLLDELRALGCTTGSLPHFGSYVVDVPGDIPFTRVDEVLARRDLESVAVAFPSFRHPE